VALVLSAGRAEDAGARIAATLVVELLYTVQIALREHTLVPESFLLVGLISAIGRVLVLTAEFDAMVAQGSITPQQFAVELAVLAALILALAVSLILLHRRRVMAAAVGPA
jgi:carbon starvation protein CstA